jgi:hypothetical protein
MIRAWCPGGGDWAIDVGRSDDDGRYRCYGCLRMLRIPKSGHRVGLVPTHKRTSEQRAQAIAVLRATTSAPPTRGRT